MLILLSAIAAPRVVAMSNTYETLAEAWWTRAMEAPYDTNPVVDETGADCDEDQSGSYWHLGGTFTGTADRTCLVSRSRYLFFPVFTAICFDEAGESDESDLRNCMDDYIDEYYDLVDEMWVEVDGSRVSEPEDYDVDTDVFSFTVPEDNVVERIWGWDAPAGTEFEAAVGGLFLLLPPMRAGTHTIDIYADFPAWAWTMDLQHTVIVR